MTDDEERPSQRSGRGYGPIDANTPEAAELATWLRLRAGGRPLRELGDLVGYKHARMGVFLKGQALPTPWLLDNLVAKLVPPKDQRLQQAHGRELLEAAKRADAALKARNRTTPEFTASEHQRRLADSFHAQQMAEVVEGQISRLITLLQHVEQEARRGRSHTHQNLDEIKQRLDALEERAQLERDEAAAVAFEARIRVDQHRFGFQRVTGEYPLIPLSAKEPVAVALPEEVSDYDRFFQDAGDQLDLYKETINDVRRKFDLSPGEQPPHGIFVPGIVIPPPADPSSADNNDETPTSADDANTGSRPQPPSGPGSRSRPPRPHLLQRKSRVALVGAACLALLAGGGWITWDHLHNPKPAASPPSQTLKAAQVKGYLVVGLKGGQPGLSERIKISKDPEGLEDPSNWKGFDAEIAKEIGARLNLRIKVKEVISSRREDELESGEVDFIVGSYSINEDRKQRVAFAGPYFRNPQGIMMYTAGQKRLIRTSGDDGVLKWSEIPIQNLKGWDGLLDTLRNNENYRKVFKACTAAGSTSMKLPPDTPDYVSRNIFGKDDYQGCVNDLLKNEGLYSALITDWAVLAGFQKKYPGKLDLLKHAIPGSSQDWGVGLPKSDATLKRKVCDAIRDIERGDNKSVWYDLRKKFSEGVGNHPPPLTECPGPSDPQ